MTMKHSFEGEGEMLELVEDDTPDEGRGDLVERTP